MADAQEHDVELASAYLDDEATADERARVEADRDLLAVVEQLRRVRAAVADPAAAPASARESAITAAMAVFDELHSPAAAAPAPPAPPGNVVSLGRHRRMRWMQVATAAAAATVMVVGGFVIANRGSDDQETVRDAALTTDAAALDQHTTVSVESLPAAEAGVATPLESIAGASPAMAPPTPVQTMSARELEDDSAPDAAFAPVSGGAADEALPVFADADELFDVAEALDGAAPPLVLVIERCRRGDFDGRADARFAEPGEDTVRDVVLATVDDAVAAVATDACEVVLRTDE